MEQEKLSVINKISQIQMHIQQTRMSVKLYSRELCSTIDPYKNGENAYIYLELTQALKARSYHEFNA